MSFTSAVTTLATKGTEPVRELPMPPWAFGVVAFASFVVLLGVLWSFRNTAARHDRPAGAGHGDARGGQGSHGATDHGATDHGATDHGATDHGATDHGADR
jgi:hypothetical protein